ncbi:MAG: trypsin-like peptidase domain-containing protein [Rubrivivax sp.]|jgi:Do/DeqQ family serine protease|nr:trypsin-like peptidase domain-containing protein [Rubrivivax sp.]
MWRRTWLVFSQAVTVALAVLFVVMTLKPEWLPRSTMGTANLLPAPTLQSAPPPLPAASAQAVAVGSYAQAARVAAPAVVSVLVTKATRRNPHTDDPTFRFYFGDRGRAPQAGLGSGVIVSPEGYVLTNNHVVEGAEDVDVQLADGRQVRARVIGTDAETDLAVLKIEVDRVPAITLGRSADLQVGDAVLAIGNPFNVGQTVTAGIVSAVGRKRLGLTQFENFIQTDAAINPGNSGGALVDVAGNLVGINTAIFSQSGGSQGIGFAIPVDAARQVMEALIRDGQVTRGWLGVESRDLTPEFAESFGLPIRKGALITGVLQDGAASKAGVRPGDVVVDVDGSEVGSTGQLLDVVAALKPGASTKVRVQRGERTLELTALVAQRPRPEQRP